VTTAYQDSARQRLRKSGVYLMAPGELNRRLGVDGAAWRRFAEHWNELAPDAYAAELGTTRLRRYGHFTFTPADGRFEALPERTFVQPENSNPLYVGREREFEPLTDRFANDPLLQSLLAYLGSVATTLDDVARWDAKVTPFRTLAYAGRDSNPTPEGMHRDGVTLVTSLLIGRDNAVGGESSVVDRSGQPLLTATLTEPGQLVLGDDRRTLHGVSSIRPQDPARPARRDVLVVTFAPSAQSDRPPRQQGCRDAPPSHAAARHRYRGS
jgi:hypothetical protein